MKTPETFEEMVSTAGSIDPVAYGFSDPENPGLEQADAYITMSSDVGVEGPESSYEGITKSYHLACLHYISEPRDIDIWDIEAWARKLAVEDRAREDEGWTEMDRTSHTQQAVAIHILAQALGHKFDRDNPEKW